MRDYLHEMDPVHWPATADLNISTSETANDPSDDEFLFLNENLARADHRAPLAPLAPLPSSLVFRLARTVSYFWEDGIFKPRYKCELKYDLPHPTLGQLRGDPAPETKRSGDLLIKFLIRSLTDPLGRLSPSINVGNTVLLSGIFEWYIKNTYPGGNFVLPVGMHMQDYYLMEIDLARRTFGKKYYYLQPQGTKPLTIKDLDWFSGKNFTKIRVVSSDRIPKGDYKSCEE